MPRTKRKPKRDDSFTSVTSLSTISSEQVLEKDKSRNWRKLFRMGQKNTHENKGSRPASAKNSPSASKSKIDMADEANKTGDEFEEVLDSDTEEKGGKGYKYTKDEEQSITTKMKYKLESLMGGNSSEESTDEEKVVQKGSTAKGEESKPTVSDTVKMKLLEAGISSSEDDYDKPEEVERSSQPTKRKRAIQNWRMMVSKLTEKNIQTEEHDDSDESGKQETKKRATRNWKSLGMKIKQKENPFLSIALKDRTETLEADSNSESDGESDTKDMGELDAATQRAVKNWEILVKKALVRVNPLGSLKDHLEKLEVGNESQSDSISETEDTGEQEELNQRAIRNWEILVKKALVRVNPLGSLKDHLEKLEVGNENQSDIISETEDTGEQEESNQRAIRNWEIIGKKAIDRVNPIGTLTERFSKHSQSNGSSHKDVPPKESALKNWAILTKRLLMKMPTRKSMKEVLKDKMELVADKNEIDIGSDDNAPLRQYGDKGNRAMKNWKRITSKVKLAVLTIPKGNFYDDHSDDDFVNVEEDDDAVSDVITEGKAGDGDSDISVGSNIDVKIVRKWEKIVSKLLEMYGDKNMDFGEIITTYPVQDILENKSMRAIRCWEIMVAKLLRKIRKDSFDGQRLLLASYLKDTKPPDDESLDSENYDTNTKGRALNNWKKISIKLIEGSKRKDDKLATIFHDIVTKDDADGGKRNQRSESVTEMSASEKVKTTKAERNWERLTIKLIERGSKRKTTVRNALGGKMDKVKESQRNNINKNNVRTEESKKQRALQNWERILANVLDGLTKTSVYGVLKDKLDTDNSSDNLDLGDDVCHSCRKTHEFPILLSCSHTFCRDCVTELIENSNGCEFKCPKCEGKNQLSEEEEELFCPNFIVLKKMQQQKSGETGCRNCGKDQDAEIVCIQCAELYCEKCADKHKQYDRYRSHELSDIAKTENIDNLVKKYYCLKHPDEELNVYCLDCDVSVCSKCAKKKHKGANHDCGSINDAAKAGRKIIKDAAKRLEGRPNLKLELQKIGKMQGGLDAEMKEMKEEITKSTENLIAKIREREAELYREVEERHRVINEELTEHKQNTHAAMLQAGSLRKFLKELRKHKNDLEMLQMQATITNRMSDILDLENGGIPEIDYDFVFHAHTDHVENDIKKFGGIDIFDRNSGGKIFVDGFDEDKTTSNEYRIVEEERKSTGKSHEVALESWSPTVQPKKEENKENTGPKDSDSEENKEKEDKHELKRKRKKDKGKEKEQGIAEDASQKKTDTGSMQTINKYEEIEPKTYDFKGPRSPPYEGFTQLTSERGESVNILKYGVKNHKNETCDIKLRMVCPDHSIVSAHVAENADGAFTVFFCPEIKRDFNCFITIGGEHFKKEYKILNFYGDFQGMKSKEIDLACRAMSLLRWHVTPGLLENKNGKVKRSRKFLRILGTRR